MFQSPFINGNDIAINYMNINKIIGDLIIFKQDEKFDSIFALIIYFSDGSVNILPETETMVKTSYAYYEDELFPVINDELLFKNLIKITGINYG